MKYYVMLLLFTLVGSAYGQTMSHEETVVRTAYAKLTYAVEQGAVSELAFEAGGAPVQGPPREQRIADAQVRFALSDFKTGNAIEILNRKVVDFITPASGETLAVMGRTNNYVEDGKSTMWYAPGLRWTPAQQPPPDVQELTMDELYQLQWQQKRPGSAWQRYASYSVNVTYRGKSKAYKALFMFGHDIKGNESVEVQDAITEGTGLAQAMHEHLFPDAFLRTRLRDVPTVAEWIKAKQTDATECSDEQGICCDLATLQCGPRRSDVEKALAAKGGL